MKNSFFLEGLKTARELVKNGDIDLLDTLIAEHESGMIETAAIAPQVESR